MEADRKRLDNVLVERGLYQSRARARDAIERGCILVNGKPAVKAGAAIAADAELVVADAANAYVSRAALKLISGLERSGLDPAATIAVDIGASTGGFTQVLIERNAAHVYAIDVGHGQMDPKITALTNVSNVEGINARDLTLDHLDQKNPQFIVCDVSFISLKLVLPPILHLAAAGAGGIFLYKPQFELGREHLGKGGIVRDPALARTGAKALADWIETQMGWQVIGLYDSPIAGGDGNQEFLLAARKKII